MKVSDNPFPSILIEEGTAPSAPSAGQQRLFIDSADQTAKLIDSSSTVTPLGGGGGGGSSAVMGASAYNSGAQSIPNATETPLTLDTEEFDTDGIHSTSSNQSRFVVPTGGAGYWAGHAYVPWAGSGSGSYRYLWWRKNGTRIRGTLTSSPQFSGPGQDQQNTLRPVLLADGDYLELAVQQDTGGALGAGISGDQLVAVAVWRVGD